MIHGIFGTHGFVALLPCCFVAMLVCCYVGMFLCWYVGIFASLLCSYVGMLLCCCVALSLWVMWWCRFVTLGGVVVLLC